eukprot:4820869-Alexandrium_andersonii.AAC.1
MQPAPMVWDSGLLGALGAGAWKKAGVKMEVRSGVLSCQGGSPSLRSVQWNAYAVSLVLYPSLTSPLRRRLRAV